MSLHSWEQPERSWSFGAPPVPTPDLHEGSDEEDFEDDEFVTGAAAGERLSEMLLHLYYHAKISAKQLCTLAWWCHGAGAVGFVERLKLNPNTISTGHFQRHLDSVLQLDASGRGKLKLQVPSFRKFDLTRELVPTIVQAPHEMLAAE
eukprot:1757590-Alexandrium_andersonii.AAC.1